MKRNSARTILLLAGVFWALGFIVNKSVLDSGWTATQLLFVRFFTAAVFMILIYSKRIFKADIATIKSGIKLGIILFLAFAFQTFGLASTTATNNALITAGYIVFLPIIVLMIDKKHVKRKALIASIVTFIGVIVVSIDIHNIGSLNIGDLFTFIGAIFWAFHIFFQGKDIKGKDPITLMAYQFFVVSILAFLLMMFTDKLPNVVFTEWNSLRILIGAVVIGFLGSFLAFTFQCMGQQYLSETETAILISSESLFGPILGIILLNEPFNVQIVLGMILVLGGITLSELNIEDIQKRRKSKQ